MTAVIADYALSPMNPHAAEFAGGMSFRAALVLAFLGSAIGPRSRVG